MYFLLFICKYSLYYPYYFDYLFDLFIFLFNLYRRHCMSIVLHHASTSALLANTCWGDIPLWPYDI